jgi:hypothetical protein
MFYSIDLLISMSVTIQEQHREHSLPPERPWKTELDVERSSLTGQCHSTRRDLRRSSFAEAAMHSSPCTFGTLLLV